MVEATLLVLAGGESRRMGRPKALLPVGATTLVEYLVERLAPSFDEVLVSAREADQLPAGLRDRLVRDLHLGQGPLAGIEAGLAAARHDVLFALACDIPNLSPELAGRLVAESAGHDAAVPRVGGRPQPAAAAYRRSAAAAVAASLGAGRLRVTDTLEELDVRWVDDLDPEQLWNMNTPADYQVFLDAMRKSR